MSTQTLERIVRALILAEGAEQTFWEKSGSRRIISFPKMKKLLVSLGAGPLALTMLEKRIHTMSDAELSRYDSLIIQESARHGVNPALIKAMGLLESKLGQSMQGNDTQRGFIHMTRTTYAPYFPEGTSDDEMKRVMLSPEESMPICVRHVKRLIQKFNSADAVIFSIKTGENKLEKESKGAKNPEEVKRSLISSSDYTQASLVLRKLFAKDGPLPVGGSY